MGAALGGKRTALGCGGVEGGAVGDRVVDGSSSHPLAKTTIVVALARRRWSSTSDTERGRVESLSKCKSCTRIGLRSTRICRVRGAAVG